MVHRARVVWGACGDASATKNTVLAAVLAVGKRAAGTNDAA